MHTLFNRSLTAAAVTLALAGAVFASQASKPSSSTKPAATTGVSTKAKSSSASHSAMGTIEKYDANTLTLKTSSGEEQFTLAPSAHLRHGSKTIKAEDLSGLSGQQAKVRYTESNGQRTAESVMVSDGAHKSSSKKSTEKK